MSTKTCPICQAPGTGLSMVTELSALPWSCDCAGFTFAVSTAVLENPLWQSAGEEARRAALFRARRARRNTAVPVVLTSDLDLPSAMREARATAR